MGDLILTFPLLIWLQRYFPGHPIWVAAEEVFFKGLMPIAPEVTFFPSEALSRMHGNSFHMVINLSHRPEAAALGPKIKTEKWLGPRQDKNGSTYVHGDWQLYRASLTHNNRHNQFHWADLNLLDIIPFQQLSKTGWAPPKIDPGSKNIGLFLGASEPAKRPSAQYWTELASVFLKRGFKPVLLGGKHEAGLGREVGTAIGSPQLNMCGRFNVPGFMKFIQTLDFFITPDTGPMHLASWLEKPILNLSLGSVNAWDTGPYLPGALVLRSNISCRGCWHCNIDLRCHNSFSAQRSASLVKTVLSKGLEQEGRTYLGKIRLPGQELFYTTRKNGLYKLASLDENASPNPHNLMGEFWHSFFGAVHGIWPENIPQVAWQQVIKTNRCLLTSFDKAFSSLTQNFSASLKKGTALPSNFWASVPPLLRPATGYLHMLLQNGDYSPSSFSAAMNILDFLSALTEQKS